MNNYCIWPIIITRYISYLMTLKICFLRDEVFKYPMKPLWMDRETCSVSIFFSMCLVMGPTPASKTRLAWYPNPSQPYIHLSFSHHQRSRFTTLSNSHVYNHLYIFHSHSVLTHSHSIIFLFIFTSLSLSREKNNSENHRNTEKIFKKTVKK